MTTPWLFKKKMWKGKRYGTHSGRFKFTSLRHHIKKVKEFKSEILKTMVWGRQIMSEFFFYLGHIGSMEGRHEHVCVIQTFVKKWKLPTVTMNMWNGMHVEYQQTFFCKFTKHLGDFFLSFVLFNINYRPHHLI